VLEEAELAGTPFGPNRLVVAVTSGKD